MRFIQDCIIDKELEKILIGINKLSKWKNWLIFYKLLICSKKNYSKKLNFKKFVLIFNFILTGYFN